MMGLDRMIFASRTVKKDCSKARSGGAAYAAAKLLEVPLDEVVTWMKAAENMFAQDYSIVFNPCTKPETFHAFLVEARRIRLKCVPPSCTGDEDLAARMAQAESVLLGANRCNCAVVDVVELIRWVLLDRPRPQ